MCTSKWDDSVTKPKIIVVDDCRSVRAVVRRSFERAGYTVFDTNSGAQAMDTILDERPDVMLLDIHIPGLGLTVPEFVSRVTATCEAHGIALELLLFSGRSSTELHELSVRYGADGYLQKSRRITQCVTAVSAKLSARGRAPACV